MGRTLRASSKKPRASKGVGAKPKPEVAKLRNELAQERERSAAIAMENARLLGELHEALEQQTATSEVLRVISGSATDVQPVFEAIVARAAKLCEADFSAVARLDNDLLRLVAINNVPPDEAKAYHTLFPCTPSRTFVMGRAFMEGCTVHVEDVLADPDYDARARELHQSVTGFRTVLGVPILRDGKPIGVIGCGRREVRPFTPAQIALVTSFADQAVIAVENARLLGELRERTDDLQESLEYQTATSDVLKVISRSTFDLQRVLDTLVETAAELCETSMAGVATRQGDVFRYVATAGCSPEFDQAIRTQSYVPGRGTTLSRVLLERKVVHVADITADPDLDFPPAVHIANIYTLLGVPMFREDEIVGVITLARQYVKPFTDRQIELVRTFAAQAVIAMENARLLTETREALEQQTATAEILQIINASPGDLRPVFDTILDKALWLCDASFGAMARNDGDCFRLLASRNVPASFLEFLGERIAANPGGALHRLICGEAVVHVTDIRESYGEGTAGRRALVDMAGARTALWFPLRKDDAVLGAFVIYRREVRPFTDKQIALAQNFAGQAVIAVDNARLLGELRERQAELRVTFDNMGDGVALFDAEPRLVAWNRNFQNILDLPDALLAQRLTYVEYIKMLADRGEFGTRDNIEEELARRMETLDRPALFARTRPDGKVIEARRNPVPGGGFVLIYSDITERKRAEAEIGAARDAAEKALREVQAAQASLLHSQKMAALGQLTAGIAHEIKNPLNFVNNFADLSVELLDELRAATADRGAEIDETMEMLSGNLTKIAEHGRRADGIVKSMLAHSRGGSGDRQSTDLNALVEEALNLAYHGARAQDQTFNITMERNLASNLAPIEVVPQDFMRVLLNLFGNGFYAAHKRGKGEGNGFKPTMRVSTTDLGEHVEIRVRDNGIGIAPEHREKLFQPFFTTKPTGEGTGLGLSISYDIVTQQHGGTIACDSELGQFTEFVVRLPRRVVWH
jgi:two-component system, NtrC family, sensor kinase